MIVYRIEHEITCAGPFSGFSSHSVKTELHRKSWNIPNPQVDRGIERWPFYDEICAFRDLTQLVKWFNEAGDNMLSMVRRMSIDHFNVYEIDARVSAQGQYQVLIDRPTAKRIAQVTEVFGIPIVDYPSPVVWSSYER